MPYAGYTGSLYRVRRAFPFGTHELVKYYEMIRELLWSCWATMAELATSGSVDLARFLNREVPRLERVRDEWLNTPDPDCYHRTPRSMIDRERARLPEALFGRDAIIDPDCPCCQMLAELPGPSFRGRTSCIWIRV